MINCDCGGAHVDVEAPRQGSCMTLGSLSKASGLGNLTSNTPTERLKNFGSYYYILKFEQFLFIADLKSSRYLFFSS